MVIYYCVEIIIELFLPPIFQITYTIIKKYHQGELVNINIISLIIIIQENNRVIATKKGKVELLLLCDNVEQVIHFYAAQFKH